MIQIAVAGAAAGAIVASSLAVAAVKMFPPPVTPTTPVVELANERMTITRLNFTVGGFGSASCYLTVYPDSARWRLEC